MQKANVLRESGQVAEAEQALVQAIEGIESLRTQVAGGEMEGQRYFATRQDPYYAMIDLLISQNRGTEALRYFRTDQKQGFIGCAADGSHRNYQRE